MLQQPYTPFKEAYTKQRRIKMHEDNKAKKNNSIIVIVQKHPVCKGLPNLKHCRFSIDNNQKVMEVCNAIRKRIIDIDNKYQSQPFFLYANKTMPNKQLSMKQVYDKFRDEQDCLLYLKYSNMDPYGN